MAQVEHTAQVGRDGEPGTSAQHRTLLVIDSFRVRGEPGAAEARCPSRHIERFARSILAVRRELGQHDPDWEHRVLRPFLDAVPAEIDAAGAGFPRLEAWGHGDRVELALAIRPCPPLASTIDLRTVPPGAASGRRRPWAKGPNVAAFARLAARLGSEPLLVDRDGAAVEGGTVSLVWWEGPVLTAVASDDRVASVTEGLVLDAARRLGIPTRSGSARPELLRRRETWALNALHGIRVVSSIDGVALPRPDPARLRALRAALDACFTPLVPAAAGPPPASPAPPGAPLVRREAEDGTPGGREAARCG